MPTLGDIHRMTTNTLADIIGISSVAQKHIGIANRFSKLSLSPPPNEFLGIDTSVPGKKLGASLHITECAPLPLVQTKSKQKFDFDFLLDYPLLCRQLLLRKYVIPCGGQNY